MNGTSLIRWSTVLAVTAIAGVAGWVSYEHALAVVRAHGESGAVATAYPVTVDGLIYSASMVLLDSARRGVRAPALARWLLALGIGATLLANVTAGVRFGVTGAVVAAWPALALVGSYELLMSLIRREAAPAAVTIPTPVSTPGTVAGDVPGSVPGDVSAGVPVNATVDAPAGTVPPAPDVTVRAVSDAVPPSIPASVPHVPRTAPVRRPQRRASSARPKSPERVFATELAAGQVPSLRQVKERMHVGTDRARVIRDQLGEVMQEKAA